MPLPYHFGVRHLDKSGNAPLRGNKIVYFHVPKCGGTSIKTAFADLYGPSAEALDAWATRDSAAALGVDLLDVREHWLYYQVAQARASCIGGHFPWSPTLAAFARDYRLVTMLREPRSHFLSAFFWNRDKPKRKHYPIDQNTRLKDFVHSERAVEIGSNFVRYFTDPQLRRMQTDPHAVDAACRNIMTLDVVGTLDHIDELVVAIEHIIGQPLRVGHVRPSPTSKADQDAEIDDDVLAAVDKLCRPNRAVYDAVCQRRADRGYVTRTDP